MKLKSLLLALCLLASSSAYAGNIETNGTTPEDAASVSPVADALLGLLSLLSIV